MSNNLEALKLLRPEGGYIQYGYEYEGIEFIDCEPFSKEEYEKALVDAKKIATSLAEQKAAARIALLDKLGITEDEAKLLLS